MTSGWEWIYHIKIEVITNVKRFKLYRHCVFMSTRFCIILSLRLRMFGNVLLYGSCLEIKIVDL